MHCKFMFPLQCLHAQCKLTQMATLSSIEEPSLVAYHLMFWSNTNCEQRITMVGIPLPRPDRILDYPQNGELKYLFRKALTISDLAIGLILERTQSDHLMRLPKPLLDAVARDGLMVRCCTPAIHHGVVLTFDGVEASFRFQSSGGWDEVASENRLGIGDQIDCWSLYDAEDGPHGKLSFLIQKVGGPFEVFHASASGGTATSS